MDNSYLVPAEPISFNKKLMYSLAAAIIFILVSLPQVYHQTDRVTNTYANGCPTSEGKFLHSVVFFAISYFLMKISVKQRWNGMTVVSDAHLAKYAFYATLLFFVFASTDAYMLTGRMMGDLASAAGCPTVRGIIVHAIIFMVVLLLTMYFPMDC